MSRTRTAWKGEFSGSSRRLIAGVLLSGRVLRSGGLGTLRLPRTLALVLLEDPSEGVEAGGEVSSEGEVSLDFVFVVTRRVSSLGNPLGGSLSWRTLAGNSYQGNQGEKTEIIQADGYVCIKKHLLS